MRKLGKKNHETIETVEAYINCSGVAVCNCNKYTDWNLYAGTNDDVYNAVYYSRN